MSPIEGKEIEALARSVVDQFEQVHQAQQARSQPEVQQSRSTRSRIRRSLADTVAAHLALKIPEKQELCSNAARSPQRLEKVYASWKARSACCRSRSASAAA
jgi:ATP-dependent Lon protease